MGDLREGLRAFRGYLRSVFSEVAVSVFFTQDLFVVVRRSLSDHSNGLRGLICYCTYE